MNRRTITESELPEQLRRIGRRTAVPPVDPEREARLLAAFDASQQVSSTSKRGIWWMTGLAAAASLLVAFAITSVRPLQRGVVSDPVSLQSPAVAFGEFVPWPGTSRLPPLESGELLRVQLPVSVLPSLGLIPPSTRATSVRADVLVGQDGLTRAVRLVD